MHCPLLPQPSGRQKQQHLSQELREEPVHKKVRRHSHSRFYLKPSTTAETSMLDLWASWLSLSVELEGLPHWRCTRKPSSKAIHATNPSIMANGLTWSMRGKQIKLAGECGNTALSKSMALAISNASKTAQVSYM